jgi:hypothetical protein
LLMFSKVCFSCYLMSSPRLPEVTCLMYQQFETWSFINETKNRTKERKKKSRGRKRLKRFQDSEKTKWALSRRNEVRK